MYCNLQCIEQPFETFTVLNFVIHFLLLFLLSLSAFVFFYRKLNSFSTFPFLAVEHVFFKVCTLTCFSSLSFFHLIFSSVQKLIPSKSYCDPTKVPFEEVPDLVASRRVFLSKGYAYVAMSQVCC